jgi:hypothetical protein
MRTLTLLFLGSLAFAGETAPETVTIAPFEKDRRWVVVEAKEGRIVVPFIPANEKAKVAVKSGGGGITLTDDPAGFISVKSADREITRYYTGAMAEKSKKPFFWPLNAYGVNLLRGHPVEVKAGEPADHPHHTGLYFAFGDVNGKEYWSKTAITPKAIVKKEQGPGYARIVAQNAWGEELNETQDITILDAGADIVMDWTITLTAANGPVVLGKDPKAAKEGAFAARVNGQLSQAKARPRATPPRSSSTPRATAGRRRRAPIRPPGWTTPARSTRRKSASRS